ncbi:MAG: CehA/McbA family metallohydrolase [Fuerstiella sp.]
MPCCYDRDQRRSRGGLKAILAVVIVGSAALGSDTNDRQGPAAIPVNARAQSAQPVLRLAITSHASGDFTPARFSLTVDGKPFYPEALNAHGLRFKSVHEAKRQVYVVLYSRGTGVVDVSLPAHAKRIVIAVAKGFEFLPASQEHDVATGDLSVNIALRRWTNQLDKGWLAADAHVHYDRLDREGDRDWLAMLAGDDLAQAHFMVLKGGKVPGIWAQQYKYGTDGEASDGERLIRSGEEYRDSAQGHINLLGLSKIIEPISTGGLGHPPVPVNYPPLKDVLEQTRQLGGLAGVAHGGSLGRHPTAIVDSVLNAVDFFEIGNAHLYSLDLWYGLMNCGFNLPPAAGTDLPNFPVRDAWQPFLGSMRMYVKTDGRRDFESWKRAVSAGQVLVTSGPVLSLNVSGVGPGGIVRLPASGGEVTIDAEIATPIGLKSFELVRMGDPVAAEVEKTKDGQVFRWRLHKRLQVRKSCWLAVRGEGQSIESVRAAVRRQEPWFKSDTVAHSAAIRIMVGDQPIRSTEDAEHLIETLQRQQEYYRTSGRYAQGEHRLRVLDLFERAITKLESRSLRN